MHFNKKAEKIAVSLIIILGILLSPIAKGFCMAQTYTSNVSWSSNGRYITDNVGDSIPALSTHYFFGGSSGIEFSYFFNDGIGNNAAVYENGSLIMQIACNNSYTYTIDANKMYQVTASAYGYSIYSGYKITFKDQGGGAFTGSLDLCDQYCYYQSYNFKVTATPTRAGYTFKGWFNDPDCTTPHAGLTGTITSDPRLTVYALWEKNNNSASYEGRLYNLVDEINRLSKEDSKEVRTIFFSEGSSLPLMVMEALNNSNETVKLDFISEYDGKKYHFVISGGTNPHLSKDIPWYGPLWLNQYYSVPLE